MLMKIFQRIIFSTIILSGMLLFLLYRTLFIYFFYFFPLTTDHGESNSKGSTMRNRRSIDIRVQLLTVSMSASNCRLNTLRHKN